MNSDNEIVRAIRNWGGLPQTDAEVLGQKEYYFPSTWKAHWPASLPEPLELAAVDLGDRARRYVTRSDVFSSSAAVTTEIDALNLYVVMCGWGAGWQGLTGWRARRPLDTPEVAQRLLESHLAARNGHDPVEIYEALRAGDFKIKYFGPAFFTKWIYFSAYYRTNHSGLRPLILDSRVATTLGWRTGEWTSDEYKHYLELAHEAAAILQTEPHVIEHSLYAINSRKLAGSADSHEMRFQLPTGLVNSITKLAEENQQLPEEFIEQVLAKAVGFDLPEAKG